MGSKKQTNKPVGKPGDDDAYAQIASAELTVKRLARLSYASLGMAVVSAILIVVLATRPTPPPKGFSVDPQGSITPLTSFEQVPASPTVLMNIAERYAMELLDMNAINAERRLEENRSLFISDAYFNAYKQSLTNSPWYQQMIDSRLSMRAIPADLPMISRAGEFSRAVGMREWQLSVPIRIRIEGPGVNPQTAQRVILLQLVHARSPEYRYGIAVAGIRIERARN